MVDNKKYVELLWAGKINLIYIDPPFFTGADFSIRTTVGGEQVEKAPSIIEERAYSDTWSGGIASYIKYMYERLILMRELLAENGSIYVHIDWHVGHYVMMDEIFGYENFISQIVWQRTDAHSNVTRKYGTVHDIILFYGKSISCKINLIADLDKLSSSAIKEYSLIQLKNGRLVPYKEGLEGRRVKLDDITVPNVKAGKLFLRDPQKGAARCKVSYLDERLGIIPQDIWINVGRMKGGSRFNTEKPERLLQRIINISSDPGDIVADFFCGSGTTLAAAEKLGRRWLGCDLSKFAVQVTRKRLLDIHNSKDLQE